MTPQLALPVRVLVVDDQMRNIVALEAALASIDCVVVRAQSGRDALRCSLAQDFAVILLDVHMPDMDGFETATLIRSREQSRATPIMFLTADDRTAEGVQEGYRLGAVDYLYEPFDGRIVRAKVSFFVDLFRKTVALEQRTAELTLIATELERSKEHFRALIEDATDLTFITEASGVIRYASPAVERTLGYSRSDILGLTVAALLHPDDVPLLQGDIARLLESRAPNPPTGRRWRHVNGSYRTLESSTSNLLDNPSVAGLVVHARDVTERNKAEAQVRELNADLEQRVIDRTHALSVARDEALAGSRAKSAFLATMSHEIRTPMNGVIGMSGLLIDTGLSPRQFEYADAVRRSGEALLTIINDILDFSKLEAGILEIELTPVNVREAVQDVLELLAEQAHGKGLELAALGDTRTSLGMLGDPGRLRQVLMNLVGNALKFTDEGEVVVRMHVQEQTMTSTTVRLEVSDTGPGISEEARARLFQPFSQADSSTTRKYGGTGLGLAICKGLVEQMGGMIGVTSEPGQGSTFWFTVRLTGSPASIDTITPALASVRVLAVDDNATARTGLDEQLTTGGFSVTVAADGSSALAHLRSAARNGSPYTFALIDRHMPGMDGLELAGAIRADASIADIPMVLLTSVADQIQTHGFASVVTKPARSTT